MKNNITLLLGLTTVSGFAATGVTVRNFVNATEGLPLVDNTGAVLPIGDLKWEVGTFESAFAGGISGLDPVSDDATVLSSFTPAGPSGAFNFDGIFSRSVQVDEGGALGAADTPLFVVLTYTPQTGDPQAMVLDFSLTFPEQSAGNASVPTQTVGLGNIIFGGQEIPLTDQGNIPGAFSYSTGVTFDPTGVIPEPSTSLLAALAGLGLVARRRR